MTTPCNRDLIHAADCLAVTNDGIVWRRCSRAAYNQTEVGS
jgi:hypothetical protein